MNKERHKKRAHTSHDRENLVEKINSLINCQVWTVDNLLATTLRSERSKQAKAWH